MAIDKKTFMKSVTVLYDTREQKNEHILSSLSQMGIMTEERKLDYGDYSFTAEGRDFSLSCAVERKASVDEIYGNIMSDRGRIEKELYSASQLAKQFTLLIEGVSSWEELRAYEVPDWQMKRDNQRKIKAIGALVYPTVKGWHCANRYRFGVEFCAEKDKSAAKMLEIFYYYWRNYKEMTGVRK
jgi:hypothetical protein